MPRRASLAEEIEFWRDAGIYYFVPCVFEGGAMAVLALGRKESDEPLNSEDLALLTAVAGQVATAIENGRLYRQLHLKAEELGRMREFNENILESLDDGLVVFDVDERIVRWNRALEEIYGVSRDERSAGRSADMFDAPFVEALARRAARRTPPARRCSGAAVAARRTVAANSVRLLVNATVVPLQIATAARRGRSGRSCCIEDVTERVQLEEQLQISEKMASIGLLAAGVAHEVNTPLTGISSFTQMLLEGADPSDPRTVLLEKIERQTFRAAKIVNGLLNLSRPGTPGGERDARSTSTRSSNDVLSLLEHQFEVGTHQGAPRARAGAGAGAGHRAPAAAGLPQPVPQRARRHAEGRLAVGDHAGRGRARRRRGGRHRVGHSARAPGAHLRPVLHDQGDRPGHRPRPVDHLRHRARARRHDPVRQRRRAGHALHADAACPRAAALRSSARPYARRLATGSP